MAVDRRKVRVAHLRAMHEVPEHETSVMSATRIRAIETCSATRSSGSTRAAPNRGVVCFLRRETAGRIKQGQVANPLGSLARRARGDLRRSVHDVDSSNAELVEQALDVVSGNFVWSRPGKFWQHSLVTAAARQRPSPPAPNPSMGRSAPNSCGRRSTRWAHAQPEGEHVATCASPVGLSRSRIISRSVHVISAFGDRPTTVLPRESKPDVVAPS
jgi:hypothetical protein